jgi:hypothetical protein
LLFINRIKAPSEKRHANLKRAAISAKQNLKKILEWRKGGRATGSGRKYG